MADRNGRARGEDGGGHVGRWEVRTREAEVMMCRSFRRAKAVEVWEFWQSVAVGVGMSCFVTEELVRRKGQPCNWRVGSDTQSVFLLQVHLARACFLQLFRLPGFSKDTHHNSSANARASRDTYTDLLN